jgi:hypothetical protein
MLNPDQRELARRMRKALAPLREPERRQLLIAMRQMWNEAVTPVLAELERRMAKESALSLAIEERIGHEPEGDEVIITDQDELRAKEIVAECWRDV